MDRVPGTLVLAIAVLTAGTALADAPPLLLYGPGDPDSALESRALATFNLLSDERRASPSVRHAGTALAPVPEMIVVGTDQALACQGSPVTLEPFREGLESALADVLNGEIEEARDTLMRLDALLPCLNGVLPREEIARISFLEGIGLAYFGETDEARESFRRALVVAPALQWEDRFPPSARTVFKEAVYEALHAPTAEIVVEPGVGAEASLWLDGDLYSAGGGAATLVEGRHLVQWQVEGGGFGTVVLAVTGGDSIRVISRADILATAVSGQGSGATRELAVEVLRRLATETSRDAVYLAELGSVDLLHRFDVATGRWEVSDQGMVVRRLRGKRMSTAGQISLIAGGVVAAAGTAIGISGYLRSEAIKEEEGTVQNAAEWENLEQQYEAARGQTGAGFALAGAGGACMVVSIPLLGHGSRLAASSTGESVAARFQLTPTGALLSVPF